MLDASENAGRSHSVTRWIEQLKQQDAEAAARLWQRYFQQLLPLAREQLRELPHRAVDEEDILVSVFDRFFRAAGEDRFARLDDRDDLWQILLMLTERRVADEYRRALRVKRGGRRAIAQSDLNAVDDMSFHEIAERQLGPEFIATFNDSLARTLARLTDETTKEVALLKLEGHANRDIAGKLSISIRSVERKLRVIRQVWRECFLP